MDTHTPKNLSDTPEAEDSLTRIFLLLSSLFVLLPIVVGVLA